MHSDRKPTRLDSRSLGNRKLAALELCRICGRTLYIQPCKQYEVHSCRLLFGICRSSHNVGQSRSRGTAGVAWSLDQLAAVDDETMVAVVVAEVLVVLLVVGLDEALP